jgi:hypothetical protein
VTPGLRPFDAYDDIVGDVVIRLVFVARFPRMNIRICISNFVTVK